MKILIFILMVLSFNCAFATSDKVLNACSNDSGIDRECIEANERFNDCLNYIDSLKISEYEYENYYNNCEMDNL